MANKKKRNKVYKGSNAAVKPTVVKVAAVKRHRVHQWWVDNKRIAKPVAIGSGIVTLVLITLIGVIDLIF